MNRRAATEIPTKANAYYFTFIFEFIFISLLKQNYSVSQAEFVISLFLLPLKISMGRCLSHSKMT